MKIGKNVFGIIARTPGQNFINAISTEEDYSAGIPPYRYTELFEILNSALSKEEIELLDRGFGFTCPRQQQNEIAKDLGVSDNQISNKARECIEKLKSRRVVKRQLQSLSASPDDLFAEITNLRLENDKLKNSKVSEKSQKELAHRLEDAKAELESIKTEVAELEKRNATLVYDLQSADKRYREKLLELGKAQDIIIRLNDDVLYEKARAEGVKKAFDAAIDAAQRAANDVFVRCVRDVEINNALDALHFSEDTLADLKRAGITEIRTLLKMNEGNLHRLKVRSSAIKEIKEKLAAKGLSLKAN